MAGEGGGARKSSGLMVLKVYQSFFSLLKADSNDVALFSGSSRSEDCNLFSVMEEKFAVA